jgi:glycosyltransferase involved in cell wall biosynthesis
MIPSPVTFTIITAVFNGQEFIEETVKSILRHAPSDEFEYLIVNDGSTDSTREILESFGDSIKIINQKNMGEASAVNRGLELARGKYALIVSADDPIISGELFTMSQDILDRDKKVVVTYPDWLLIDNSGKVQRNVQTSEYSIFELVGLNHCIPGPGAIFRVHEALKIGGRSENLKFGSDYEFWLRMSSLGQFQRIPKTLAQWRSHENSTSIKSRGEDMARERIQIIENYLSSSSLPPKIKRVALGNAYYSAAILRYFSKSVPHRRYLSKAFIARRGYVENARLVELIYLLLIPISEFLWTLLKDFLKRQRK